MGLLGDQTLDLFLFNLDSAKEISGISDVVKSFQSGDYKAILRNETSQALFKILLKSTGSTRQEQDAELQDARLSSEEGAIKVFITGLTAFNAFLQANVTGPPLGLGDIFQAGDDAQGLRERCLRSLDVDGVSVYQHIPHVELLCLARMVFTVFFPRMVGSEFSDSRWMRVRINAYHQRLLSGLSGGRMSDSTMLQDIIERDLKELEADVLSKTSVFGTEAKVQFLLEKAQIYIMQGLDLKARENVKMAKDVSGFEYALSGALGKRTKFQQNDISQLVVFARSKGDSSEAEGTLEKNDELDNTEQAKVAPEALDLNDDTLLESIAFAKSDKIDNSALPSALKDMKPDDQPQLQPLDQITLLTEATLKDTLSPLDKLNSEEILPYAVRVLFDKPTNWQIYTQALLVRSRIESHRSRTQERSVLQLQVIVDQIIADTEEEENASGTGDVPEIRVTQFLPRAKASESAPITERLKYIFQLNTPTRWEVETELAYAWSGAGSFVSALEIFKRLKLWAEVALCYHSVGQEDKARQIVRRQLYYSTKGPDMDKYSVDDSNIVTEKWEGDIRSPTPPHAPRLWCILGDLENDPECWLRAWEISKHRYARAQRTLGEYYVKTGDFEKARESYMQATIVNRQNNDTWSRLGDIDLRIGNWDGAVIAFQQSIMIDDTDAKTYSNLGSALLSKYSEMMTLQKAAAKDLLKTQTENGEEDEVDFSHAKDKLLNPKDILRQALAAYKRGASLAHNNWKIWDNVITIAGRMVPPSFPDLLLGFRAVIRIRSASEGEKAIDIEILRALVSEVTSHERLANSNVDDSPEKNGGLYVPPRGSLARAVIGMVQEDVVPLITTRGDLYSLVEKLALYQRNYAGALAYAEKGWRLAMQGETWLMEKEAWKAVVAATDNLVSAYENYGPQEKADGTEVEKAWRSKARSAIKGVLGKARDAWEDSGAEWELMKERQEDLKS
jgi:tetratricopeptide (TPR) repeat protein